MTESSKTLSLRIRVWSESTWTGPRLVAPVSDLAQAELGRDDDVENVLSRYLTRYLDRVPASVLARFSLPEPVTVHTIKTIIPRHDLPHRLRIRVPIEVAALVIPSLEYHRRTEPDVWVMIPKLDHTFFVPKAEDLTEAITTEVQRMAAAAKPEPIDYLDLLPPADEELTTLELTLPREAGGMAGAKARRDALDRKKKKDARAVLESVGRPLNENDGFIDGPEAVGIEEPLARLQSILSAPTKQAVMIVGEPRTGKTELLWALLRRPGGRNRSVWATSGAQLIAGMSGLGQWQERIRRVMQAAETLDAIIYLDDLADLFGERSHGIDMPAAMRPFLEGQSVRVVGEISPRALDKLEHRDVAFFAAFNRIRVDARDKTAAEEALRRRIAFDAAHDSDGPQIDPTAIEPIVELTDRYFPYRPFPAKALRLYASMRNLAVDAPHDEGPRPKLGPTAALESFSLESGIPTFLLRDDEVLKASQTRAAFEKRLIGQRAAVQAVVETICVVKAALQPTGKPLATFLFVGPTGVGKTELARCLASFLFGGDERMIRFDMSEFADPFAAERLIRGNEREEGLLTRRVRTQPFCVLLLDEIEKAHPAVFDLLLQVLGEGRLTDARGQTAYFHNAIIIMTSNLGAAHRRNTVGFDATSEVDHSYYQKQVEQTFRPELINRLDRIIAFQALTTQEIEAVTRLAIAKLERRRGIVDRGLTLHVSEEALARLAQDGYSAAYGARAIRRHIDDSVAAPLARMLAKTGTAANGATAWIRANSEVGGADGSPAGRSRRGTDGPQGRSLGQLSAGPLSFQLTEGHQQRARRDTGHVSRISDLRRSAEKALAYERVEQTRTQRQNVRTQLNAGGEGSARQRKKSLQRAARSAEDHAKLNQEHHRLDEAITRAEVRRDALIHLEEVALMSLLGGEETVGLLDEAVEAYGVFQRELPYLLLAQEPRRDHAMLEVQQVGPPGGFQCWLLPLFDDLERRHWTVEVHVPGEQPDEDDRWPETRCWGPPRTPNQIRPRLKGGPDAQLVDESLLLRVSGPYAGVLLALEQGVHRFDARGHRGATPQLFVDLIAMQVDLPDEEAWNSGPVAPLPHPTQSTHAIQKPIRRHAPKHDRLYLGAAESTIVLPLEQYWRRFEDVAVAELTVYEREPERDRDRLFRGRFERGYGGTE